jgi:putative membrane protein
VLFTVVIPPLFLLATPEWLARAIVGDGKFNKFFHRIARPIPAAVAFNILAGITHWAAIVNLTVSNGPFHYMIHTLLLFSGLLIWTPVCGPFPELHMTPQGKMVYIFLMSIVPTVPAAFLTASSGVIYQAYNHGPRLWGISVVEDQQLAGAVMKIGEGLYLWAIILVMMIKWLNTDDRKRKDAGDKFRGRLVTTVPAPSPDEPHQPADVPDYSQN